MSYCHDNVSKSFKPLKGKWSMSQIFEPIIFSLGCQMGYLVWEIIYAVIWEVSCVGICLLIFLVNVWSSVWDEVLLVNQIMNQSHSHTVWEQMLFGNTSRGSNMSYCHDGHLANCCGMVFFSMLCDGHHFCEFPLPSVKCCTEDELYTK